MDQKKLSLILFDFHKVLSQGNFYTPLIDTQPEVYKKIVETLFFPEGYKLISRWMRGELSYKDIHKMIASTVGLTAESLDEALIESVKKIELNEKMMTFSQEMRSLGIKVAILTDNMDVFTDFFVPYVGLDKKFDKIFSSAQHKKLKLDNKSEFIFDAILEMGSQPENTLFIDDCIDNGDFLKEAGGIFYQYDNYIEGHSKFIIWFYNNFPFLSHKIYVN